MHSENVLSAASLTPQQIALLQSWVGKTETLSDRISAHAVGAFSAMLDRNDPPPQPADALAPLWHWMNFVPVAPQSQLGADGHPARGGFLPPVPLPRRMWAGSRVQWNPDNPLRVGEAVQRTSRILSVEHKKGRSGELLFVQLHHASGNARGVAVTEEQDIVYRGAAQPGEPAPLPTAAETSAAWVRQITPDPVLLFRYSALTFNGHRIHYDRSYATQQEGYPGLVVHGPLIATLLIDLLRRNAPGAVVTDFSFKAVRPTYDLNPFTVLGQPSPDGKTIALWACDHEGWLTMQATAKIL
ncbi:MaoC family dehydratase N-terminal domain-containing protein [Pantoea sp. 18069]|uniref:FAS1-like dehydratase domain-containing protein n=1 Tax=Pantoea sp. 18069 TaxID=2681415 RepID=UPI001359520F|nr:MaoC family dehydratase N-terminal domain-containing protein [Pantoea sp. 18069]